MKQTLTLAFLAGTNTLVTVLFQWVVVTHLGVGVQTDALFAGMAIPQVILLVVSGSLAQVLVPLLATDEQDTFRRNAWGFFLGITGIFAAMAVILYVSAALWVHLLVPGFSPPAVALTVTLTRIQLVSMVFTASVSVLWAVYRARHKFIWVELSTLLSSMVTFALLFVILPVYGVVGAALLIVARIALQIMWLLPGLGHWETPAWSSPAMREAWRRIRPLLLGTSYYRMDLLVDRFLASMAPTGGLSLLNIGQQIYGVANVVAEKAISTPVIPLLSILARAGNWREFKHMYHRRLLAMGALTVMGYIGLLLIGERILNVLIGHGGVTHNNVHFLWLIMVALGGYFVGGAMGLITTNGFYAMGDTRTPTWLAIVTFTIYVPLKVLAFFHYGLIGLSVVTSLYMLLNVVLQAFALEEFAIPRRQAVPPEF